MQRILQCVTEMANIYGLTSNVACLSEKGTTAACLWTSEMKAITYGKRSLSSMQTCLEFPITESTSF